MENHHIRICRQYFLKFSFLITLSNTYLHSGTVNTTQVGGGYSPCRILSEYRFKRLGTKLGFSIGRNVFDYGLVIPHYGTVVAGAGNSIGKYAVLHTATCITSGKKVIGDGFYMSTGAKVLKNVKIADNVSVGCNAVVYKDVEDSGMFVAGNPAQPIKKSEAWYVRDGEEYRRRVELCEEYRKKMLG